MNKKARGAKAGALWQRSARSGHPPKAIHVETLERLIDIEVSEEYGTVTEEIEPICTMTGL